MGISDRNVLASKGGITHASFRYEFVFVDSVTTVRQVTADEIGKWFVIRPGGTGSVDYFFSLPPPTESFLGMETRFSSWGSPATAMRNFGIDVRDAAGAVVANRVTIANTNYVAEDNFSISTQGTNVDGELRHYGSTAADPGFFHFSVICMVTTDVSPTAGDYQWVVFMPQMVDTEDTSGGPNPNDGLVMNHTHFNFT